MDEPEIQVTRVVASGDELTIEGTISTITDEIVVEEGGYVTEDRPVIGADGEPVRDAEGQPHVATQFVTDAAGAPVRTDPVTETRLRPLKATGWVSAMTNHFDAEHYYPEGTTVEDKDDDGNVTQVRDVSGHLRPEATPREMTKDEKLAYCRSRLAEVHLAPYVDPAGHLIETRELDIG